MKTVNFIKAQFISLYLTYASIVAVIALYTLYDQGYNHLWFGLLLTSVPISALIAYWMVRQKTARTGSRLPIIYGLGIVGLALVLFPVTGGPQELDLPHYLAIVGFGFFLVYIYWYSRLGRTLSRDLEIGNRLPVFEALDVYGETVSSKSFEGKPTLYLFFRGNWCPLCMAQVKEVAATYQRLIDLGVEVVLISPQPENETRKLAAKFNVPFHFLTDKGGKAAQALGIDAPNGLPFGLQVLGYDSDTVLPTVIAVDSGGDIIFADQTDNYRIRPEPEVFLAVFNA
jgi:peroxiredoxin